MKTITRTRLVDRIFHRASAPHLKKLWRHLPQDWFTAIALCTLLSAGSLQAQQKSDDPQTNEPVWNAPIVVIGKDAELKEGESVEAVVVIGGSARIHGKVQNAAVAIGGDLDIDGEVGQAAVAVLGNVNARTGAKINGDAVAVGGKVDVADGAKVSRTQQSVQLPELKWLRSWFRHCVLLLRPLSLEVGWVWVVAGIFLLFYILIAALFPAPVAACANELSRRPATSFLVGMLTLLLIPFVILILAVTGVGLVVVPFILAALFLGTIVGKIGLLEWLGFKVGRQFAGQSLEVKPLLALLIGAALILLLYLIPVLGLLTFTVTRVWGLGAAVMAAFGGLRREMPEKPVPPAAPSGEPTALSTFPPPAPMTAEQSSNPGPVTNPGLVSGLEPGRPPAPADNLKEPARAAQTQASVATLAPPPVPEIVTYPHAGFWERMGAGFLDVVLVCIAGSMVGPFAPLVALAYFAGMWTWKQTTIGGIVLGLKVARLDGQPVSFAVALVRGLAAGFSIFVLFLGFLWIAWDKDKQGWHDKIAGTVVLKLPRGTPLVCI
jgi:uncharacterized RDD family membrane protein YckC